MKNKFKIFLVVITTLLSCANLFAQIPVEVFVGNQKATVDIMFFKYFKNQEEQNTRFLFFNRNRASMDYAMTETTNLPQFGFTEAISYNHQKMKGFAPVAVLSVLNKGVYSKLGFQFATIKKDFIIFSWMVAETIKEPNLDFFLLGRFTPKLSSRLHLFSQFELVNAFPTAEKKNYSFTQRFRLGIKLSAFQFGAGIDLAQLGRNNFSSTQNFGGFLRYEF